ncbi:MAG: hypothetical protein ISR84_05165 [Kiritimatiellales bacterium]|nr:hypothetical protein [Kiritimatiellales bacterium]
MKEKRSYKRFDLLSALAVLGILLILLFEGFFIFELYNIRFEPFERLLQRAEILAPVNAEEAVVPAEVEAPAPVEPQESAPVEAEEPVPAEVEEPDPVG